MIKAELIKVDWSDQCCNPKCKHSLDYHDNIIGSNFYIKRGTTCLLIGIYDAGGAGSEEIYCRECIDEVYKTLKPILDSKLWTFI